MSEVEGIIKSKRASATCSKIRKLTGNLHKRNQSKNKNYSPNKSAWYRKLSMSNDDESNSDFQGYRILDINRMISILQKFSHCRTCHGAVALKEQIECGWSSKITVLCV